jgi:hypothetical protein
MGQVGDSTKRPGVVEARIRILGKLLLLDAVVGPSAGKRAVIGVAADAVVRLLAVARVAVPVVLVVVLEPIILVLVVATPPRQLLRNGVQAGDEHGGRETDQDGAKLDEHADGEQLLPVGLFPPPRP